jgi:putative toxin-antitoxin system antitoxin component (TIGR02293 family)
VRERVPAATLRLLGGSRAVASPAGSALRFRYAAVESLGSFYGQSDLAVMRLPRINERTALRRKERSELSTEESDRLARIARVTRVAIDAFGDEMAARGWLTQPSRALGGAVPLELLDTDPGAEAVTDELGRIEFGELY